MSTPHEHSQPQDWQGGLLTPGQLREINEEAPLSLTARQRQRLHDILVDELGGPVSAGVVLRRIEKEV